MKQTKIAHRGVRRFDQIWIYCIVIKINIKALYNLFNWTPPPVSEPTLDCIKCTLDFKQIYDAIIKVSYCDLLSTYLNIFHDVPYKLLYKQMRNTFDIIVCHCLLPNINYGFIV